MTAVAEASASPLSAGSGRQLLVGALFALALGLLPVTRGQGPALLVWAAAAGSGAIVMGPALVGLAVLRHQRDALLRLLVGIMVAAGPLMLLGRLIKSATHHRPLGAMTYAVLACAVLLGACLLSSRLYSLSRSGPGAMSRRVAPLALGALLITSLILMLMSFVSLGMNTGAVVLDGTLMIAGLAVAMRLDLARRLFRVPELLAWLLWGVVVGGGLAAALLLDRSLATASLPLSVLTALVLP